MMGHCGGQLVSVANIVGFRGRDPGLIPVTLRDFVTKVRKKKGGKKLYL